MAKRRRHRRSSKTTCHAAGLKRNGRLKRGYRWARGRKKCAIPAKSR